MFDTIFVGNFRPQIGGAAISCHQIFCELARRGCRVRVLASMAPEARAETLAFDAAEEVLAIRRFAVPYYFNAAYEPAPDDWTKASDRGVKAGLEEMIRERETDALLVREGWVPFASEIAARHRIPMIAMVRGNPTAAVLNGSFPAGPGREFLDELRKATLILTVAEHFLPGLARVGIEHCRAIPNAVDVAAFSPRPRDPDLVRRLGIAESDVVVMHAGHIGVIKRPLDIVRSAREVLRRNPNARYVFVGNGGLRPEAMRLAGEIGVSGRFRFLDTVEYRQMPRYLSLADVVVVASEREGLARVYLEAQAAGKVLLASDIPAAREVVRDGETGLLFRMGDVDDLAAKTLLAVRDAGLRAEIGSKARERVRANDLETAGERYMEALGEVVSTTRNSVS